MSLTQLIKQPEVIKEICRTVDFSGIEIEKTNNPAPSPVMPRHRSYAMVGKAFDYAMRFLLQKRFPYKATGGEWAAGQSLRLWRTHAKPQIDGSEAEKVEKCWSRALQLYEAEILGARPEAERIEPLSRSLIKGCLFLGELDSFYRAGVFNHRLDYKGFEAETRDIAALLDIVPLELFSPREGLLLLNPWFQTASIAVGGADADLIVGDCIWDIKVTKYLDIKPDYLYQLAAYAALSEAGNTAPNFAFDQNLPFPRIKSAGIYFARHGAFLRFDFADRVGNRGLKELGEFLTAFGQQFYAGM